MRRIKDSSFFVLTRDMAPLAVSDLDGSYNLAVNSARAETKRNKRQTMTFDQVLEQAFASVGSTKAAAQRRQNHVPSPSMESSGSTRTLHQPTPQRPLRLADAHTARAQRSTDNMTSFEDQMSVRATNRMSTFMQGRMKDIRRLSKAVNSNMLSLDHAMAVYGAPSVRRDESPTSTDSDSPIDPRSPFLHQRLPSASIGVPVRRVPSRAEMQSATFGRKLSIYAGSRAGTPTLREKVPPVPEKPSHW